MDYEKKYKEALERAKRINDGDGIECPPGWTTCEVIFPELKAIEDANIRGAIIDYLKDNNLTEWAAWLEKQGEPKSTSWKPTKEQYGALDYAFNCCPDTELGNYFEGVLGNLIDELHKLENQGEQKSVDKIEPKHVPKFHEGDWIIGGLTKNEPRQIAEVTEEGYKTTYGGWIGFSFEKDMRLWTIQDAKDGDVLAEDSCIFIIKKLSHDHSAEIYCCLFDDGDFEASSSLIFDDTSTYPATKEQRDILFRKMNESGYEWDAERKELCPLSKSEATSDSVTQTLVDTAKAFLQALSDTPYNNTPIVEAQIITKQLLTFLSDPKAFNPNAINEHKSAEWSEEDEQLIDEVAVCLRKYEEKVQGGYSKFYVQSLADRIESLRPGNTCKATGWSEEDSYMLEQAIKCVNNSGKLDVSTEEIEDWLKSLKQRHAVEAERRTT